MLTIKNYVQPKTLEEAWQLNQKKSSRVIGGMLWLKMSNGTAAAAIDLSGLGLDQIEEDKDEFRIGCMATLRSLELHQGMEAYSQGAVREALRHIVGVQFRNLATVGGSIFGRFGFSDVLTVFMAMDSYVELYQGGIVPLKEFAAARRDRDILVRVIVKKHPARFAYLSARNTSTDFPLLTCAVSLENGILRAAVGARPARAILVEEKTGEAVAAEEKMTLQRAESFAAYAQQMIPVGKNMRAGEEYRKHLTGVLVRRACLALEEK